MATKALTDSDLAGFSKAQLRIMRNEIYARHGYIFKSKDLKDYFAKKDWYSGTVSDLNKIKLNKIEKQNVELIKFYEENGETGAWEGF